MVVVGIVIAGLLGGLAAWLIYRTRKPQTLLPSRGIAAAIKSRGGGAFCGAGCRASDTGK